MNGRYKAPVLIIGAGPTGLGAAHRFLKSGFDDWAIYEKDDRVGGLSGSHKDDKGFTWDIGGHVVFSHYGLFTRLLDDLLGKNGYLNHERESWIRILDRWLPYPFQNNIRYLPPEHCAKCLEGLINAAIRGGNNKSFENFHKFIMRTFGEGIAEIFMLPYNRKTWAYDPVKMDAGWIAERVSVPDPVRVARNIVLGQDDVGWGPNNRFRFPKSGGTGAIWEALAKSLPQNKINLNKQVVRIDVDSKSVIFDDGEKSGYGTIINTMPLDRLAELCNNREWIDTTSNLRHSSVNVIGLGIKGKPSEEMKTKCWIYFPESKAPFYRVTHFSHYSPNNAADINSNWSLMAEVSESSDKHVDRDSVCEDTIKGCVAMGLIDDEQQVFHSWSHRTEYGYPTPTIGRDKVLQSILPQLQKKSILSRGRFGSWLYEVGNMDHCYMQGYEAAGHILEGTPEFTLWRPHVINDRHPVVGWDLYV